MVVGKAYGHYVGKSCIQLLTYCYTALGNAWMVSFYALSVQLSVLVSCHVIVNIRKLASQRGQNLVQRVISPPSDSSWHITRLEPLLSCLLQVLGL